MPFFHCSKWFPRPRRNLELTEFRFQSSNPSDLFATVLWFHHLLHDNLPGAPTGRPKVQRWGKKQKHFPIHFGPPREKGVVFRVQPGWSGQSTIIPKPELRGDSLTKPHFGVTNRRFGHCNLPRMDGWFLPNLDPSSSHFLIHRLWCHDFHLRSRRRGGAAETP